MDVNLNTVTLDETIFSTFVHILDVSVGPLCNNTSSFLTIVLLIFVCVLVIVIHKKSVPQGKTAIPGPWSLPIIGTLHHIGFNPHKAFQTLRHRYGNVYSIAIGHQKMVVISGLHVIQEALVLKSTIFAGRPDMYTFQFLSEGKSLSFNTYNQTLKQHKQLAQWGLNRVVEKTNFLKMVVSREAKLLAEKLSCFKEEPINPADQILWSVGHVMYDMNFGDSRKEQSDFQYFIEGTMKLLELHHSGSFLNFFPWSRKLMGWKCKQIEKLCKSMCSLAKTKEKEHMESFQTSCMRNSMDTLILACNRSSEEVDHDRILHTTQDFIGAGLDIVTETLVWAVLYLVKFPEIQNAIKAEIISQIGNDRTPEACDAVLLPYTQAFIFEVLRHSSVVPFALPHSNMKDTSLNGYFVPKDTFIMVDLHSAHKDPITWENPDEFKPERFLNKSGSLDSEAKANFIGFSVGRRKCMGERLGKQILFIYLATLMQKLTIVKADKYTSYDLEAIFGLVLKPKPFKVCFINDTV